MASNVIITIIGIVKYLRECIVDLPDELQWNISFYNTQDQLVAAARRAKQDIAERKSEPMDLDLL